MQCRGDGADCPRKVVGRGLCSSHYRMWRAGKPLDTPVRGYRRYEEGPDGSCRPAPVRRVARKGPVFAKEYALLRSLGLR